YLQESKAVTSVIPVSFRLECVAKSVESSSPATVFVTDRKQYRKSGWRLPHGKRGAASLSFIR
ncbi:MAG: hypothetical protein Q3X52_10195, partial [Alistipes sp.]